jgi:ATP-dependent protease ClpP protease subunit
MPKPKLLQGLKPYNIVTNSALNSAEITMYGEVVEKRPTNWWTGKPIDGNFIVLNEFLDDLENLSSYSNITIRINSPGGDMNAGIVIYNRLRELDAHITTICDGLAASAASLLFLAGDTRRIYSSGIVMIHGAATLLWDYYQVQGVRSVLNMLTAHNQAGINVYVDRTGLDEAEVRQMVEAETWMTGQEAVDKGFATEVITDAEDEEPVTMKLSPDRTKLMFGGRSVAACLFNKLPDSIPQMTEAEFAALSETVDDPAMRGDNISNGGIKNMEIKNVDDLRKAYPTLVQEVENAARTEGMTNERNRIQGIESIEAAVGDAEMVRNAKYGDKPLSAQELSFAAMQKQAKIGNKMLGDMEEDTKASGAGDVAASAAPADPKANDPKTVEAQAAADVARFLNTKKEVF